MSELAITDALLTHIGQIAGRPLYGGGAKSRIVWPDDPASDPEKSAAPRWEVNIGRQAPSAVNLAGDQQRGGECRIVIVTEYGGYEAETRPFIAAIEAAFPPGITLGDIQIIDAPHVVGGFKDGEEYRTPVLIRYQVRA